MGVNRPGAGVAPRDFQAEPSLMDALVLGAGVCFPCHNVYPNHIHLLKEMGGGGCRERVQKCWWELGLVVLLILGLEDMFLKA